MAAPGRPMALSLFLLSSVGVPAIRIESEMASDLFVESRGSSVQTVDTTCQVRTVTDKQRCGTRLIDGLKEIAECRVCKEIPQTIPGICKRTCWPAFSRRRTCRSDCAPDFTPPIQCPAHCKKVEVPNECSVKAACKYRLRAHFEGKVYTGTFESMSVEAKTNGLTVVEADPAVRELFTKVEGEINSRLPPLINGEINKALTNEIEQAKVMVEQRLIDQLSKDEHIFGDYSEYLSIKDFIPDADAFVGHLLPAAAVVNTAAKSETGDSIQSEVFLYGFEAHLIENFCDGAACVKFYWLRMLPFLALSAGLAYKYPRSAAAVFLVGLGVSSTYVSSAMCHKGAPHLTRRGFEFRSKMPESLAASSGGLSVLSVEVNATEEGDLHAKTLLPKAGMEQAMRTKIVDLGDLKGKISPLRIHDAQFELRAEKHNLFIEPSSYVDLAGEVDLSCLPNCGVGDIVSGLGR